MSKLITITETDVAYRTGLAEILIREGAVATVFEVADDFDLNSYEGLAAYAPKPIDTGPVFSAKFPEVAAWLEAYNGDFDFYRSLKAQYLAKGMLSEKQIACVEKAIANDKARGATTPEARAQSFTLKPGTVVVLSKFISTKIAKQAGHTRAHRAVEIIEVEGETPKAYRAKVKLSARRTTFCGVCGLHLENPESIAAGIGPICADNYGISYGGKSLEELEAALTTTVEVTTWLPKSAIKWRSDVDPEKEDEARLAEGTIETQDEVVEGVYR